MGSVLCLSVGTYSRRGSMELRVRKSALTGIMGLAEPLLRIMG